MNTGSANKKKKILYIENVASIFSVNFYLTAARAAQKLGYEFHVAYNASDYSADNKRKLKEDYGVIFHQIDFVRQPYHPGNIKAYNQICSLIKKEHFKYIHCNTPIGGVVGRLAGKKCGAEKIIYQAHGFHFFKGAPLVNWAIYYPIEKFLARLTDALITINHEDHSAAKKFRLNKNGKAYYVHGVGINTDQYAPSDEIRKKKRSELGFKDSDILIISMGDLVPRKNYKTSIEAVAKTKNPDMHYLICGTGPEKQKLEKLSESLGTSKNIHFLGYRNDVKELLYASDIFLFSTLQEGLPRSMMEAMACGLPCVASKIRGNTDLLKNGGGVLCQPDDSSAFAKALKNMNVSEINKARKENFKTIQKYNADIVQKELEDIYSEVLR